jgi:DNA-directed RNA polymerase specialized sigma24 family protein
LREEIVDRFETQATVIEALWSLPADYREALISRYVREESVEELTVRLGRSYKATESLLSRAREALRRRLKETIEDD